jgi:hypothetical protein
MVQLVTHRKRGVIPNCIPVASNKGMLYEELQRISRQPIEVWLNEQADTINKMRELCNRPQLEFAWNKSE